MSEFSNTFHVNASQEPLVLREWEKIYADPANQFKNLLSGKTDKKALENFVALNLHPRFVIFQIIKKSMAGKSNEYVKNSKGKPYDDLNMLKFDKAETVLTCFMNHRRDGDLDVSNHEKEIHTVNSGPYLAKLLSRSTSNQKLNVLLINSSPIYHTLAIVKIPDQTMIQCAFWRIWM